LLLDEFEPNGDNFNEMMALLKSGVSNKIVLRTEGEKKREVRVYIIKSPKVFTSENPISNAGLQSRTIVVRMEKNKRKVPLYRLPNFYKESQEIRNKLLLWRLHHLNNIDLKEIEYGFPELQGFDGRVQQVITPIYYLSDPDTRKNIVEFAKIQESETKKERQDSVDGVIFQVISDNFPADTTIKSIATQLNADTAVRKISEKKIGLIVRKVLGFDIKRIGHENVSTVLTEGKEDKIEELRKYFGISPKEQVATVASDADDTLEPSNGIKNATQPATHSESDTSIEEKWDQDTVPF
jgi:hypothetical protein